MLGGGCLETRGQKIFRAFAGQYFQKLYFKSILDMQNFIA